MKRLSGLLILLISVVTGNCRTPAFPEAEGGGKYAVGGRGGAVYYVNSLEDTRTGNKKTHEGTLRWCLGQKGAKTILFKVAGIIRLTGELSVRDSTTIAGQSAPGAGICIANYAVKVHGNDVIIRFVRFRMGDEAKTEDDALSGVKNKNVIIDHCSMSWSTDECASFYDNDNFTMQWCIISESLRASVHHKGDHGYGAIWGGRNASYHHNLLAHHDSRNPRMCGSRYTNRADLELVDFRNNVIYNWGQNSGYAGEGGRYNFVNNYYKSGKESKVRNRIFSPNADDGTNAQAKGVWGKFYLNGNYIEGSEATTHDNTLGLQPNPSTKDKQDLLSGTAFPMPDEVPFQSAKQAYQCVLRKAGASFRRDRTDARVVREVELELAPVRASGHDGTKAGMIDSQKDVGGWENYTYNPSEVVTDANIDGIPDGWLEQNYPGKKANDTNADGYTYLEVYLNSLVVDLYN